MTVGPLHIDLGHRVGLIGDVHANRAFLETAIGVLADRGATALVQLGDLGLLFSRGDAQHNRMRLVNEVLKLVDMHLLVVLGNHENYDLINALPADVDGIRRLGRIWLLPASGRMVAAGHPVGWLAGAASVDRSHRVLGRSWWPQELPSPDEAAALALGDAPVEIVFAHDAPATPQLAERLAGTAHWWDPRDLEYAHRAQEIFTQRVVSVLADGGLVISGHYHLRLTADATLSLADGTTRQVRSEVLNMEWEAGSVALLDVASRRVDAFTLDAHSANERAREFRELVKTSSLGDIDLQRQLGVTRRTLALLREGHIAVPPVVLVRMRTLSGADDPE